MSLRENLSFETTIRSDTAALHGLVAAMVGWHAGMARATQPAESTKPADAAPPGDG